MLPLHFPWGAVDCHGASPQLLCSRLSKPKDLSHSSCILPSRLVVFIAFHWMFSNSLKSCLYSSAQNRTQFSKWGHAEQDNLIPPLAGSAGSEAPQGTVSPSSCQRTLLIRYNFPSARTPRFYYARPLSNGEHGPLEVLYISFGLNLGCYQ